MGKKLIKHANVFDGKNPKLKENVNIVIEENLVKEIVAGEVSEENFDEVIDVEGYTVIPGLTDAHVHVSHNESIREYEPRIDEMAVRSTRVAKDMLLRGFTTIRDAGGITFGLKKNIDNGFIDGPRIYPSNAYISQTCGHADMRTSQSCEHLPDGSWTSPSLHHRYGYVADGKTEVLRAVREQLFLGASQIKIMAGGGCSSKYDPIQTVQFTFEEMKAAVDAASDFGTYVMAHLYTPESIKRAVKAGVKSLEHTNLMDDEAAKIVKDNDVWVMPGPQFSRPSESHGKDQPESILKKADYVRRGEVKATEAINKYDLKLLFGTDSFGDPDFIEKHQLEDFSFFKKRFGSFKGLVAATGNIHELIKLTTYQNPYPDGKIGVLEEGSYADILAVKGNPVEDLDVLANEDNIRLIMKDAKIYKNTL